MHLLKYVLLASSAFALAVLNPAQAQQKIDWSGLHAGLEAGPAWGQARSEASGHFGISSVDAVLSLGYNKQFDSGLVAGVEFDLSPARGLFGNVTRSQLLGPRGPTLDTRYNTRVNWAAAPRINLGYAMGRFLPYATLGYLYGEATSTGFATVRGFPVGHETHFSTLRGPIIGAGVQYSLNERWSVGGEFLYTNAKASGIGGGGLAVKAALVGAQYHF